MSKGLSRSWERMKSVLRGRKGTDYQLLFTESGITLRWVTLENETGEIFLHWRQITTLTAYKRDLLTYDLICLLFTSESGPEFELNEEMPNWQQLVDSLPNFLPGCPPFLDWWHPVAIPAFATNETVIYKSQ